MIKKMIKIPLLIVAFIYLAAPILSETKTYAMLSIVLGGTNELYSLSEDKINGPFGNLSPNAARQQYMLGKMIQK